MRYDDVGVGRRGRSQSRAVGMPRIGALAIDDRLVLLRMELWEPVPPLIRSLRRSE